MPSLPQRDSESTYIVNPLLPTREIHLIAGGSGAGKSTLACQIATNMLTGGQFFGHPIPIPQTVSYLAFDRTPRAMFRTFERTLGTREIPFPFYSSFASPEFRKVPGGPVAKIDRLLELHPDTDVIIADGLGMALRGDSGSLTNVAQFIQAMIIKLIDYPRDLTMIALHMIGKTKKGNEYSQAREKIHGSVGWAGTTETCILVEPRNEIPGNPERLVTVCSRNLAEIALDFTFTPLGRFIPLDATIIIDKCEPRDEFFTLVAALPVGEYTRRHLRELSPEMFKISDATLTRWIEQAIDKHILERGKKGQFFRPVVTIQ